MQMSTRAHLVPKCRCQDPAVWQQRDKSPTPAQTMPMCECYTPNQLSLLFLSGPVRQGRAAGLSDILNWTHHSYLHLHCASRATAFPFSDWQYPSFLFISRLSGRRKWITGLSRRGTGAITAVRGKRNFDMWGLLTLYFLRTLGVCCWTNPLYSGC